MKILKDTLEKWEQDAIGFRADIEDMSDVTPILELLDRFSSVVKEGISLREEISLLEKINKLNALCEGTLSITSYAEWSIYSYGKDTILCVERFPNGIYASSLEKCVNKAYKIAAETTK